MCSKPTSGHNLAFWIRAHSPRRALTQTSRPNEFTRMPSNNPPVDFTWAPTRPKRRDNGDLGKRVARMCIKPNSGHNIAFFICAHSPRCSLARTTHPNELTRRPSNNLPERFYMVTDMTKMRRQGRAKKTSCINVHKAILSSQLRIFDMDSFTWE